MIKLAEQILLDKFKQEPFHNLYLLNDIEIKTRLYGGTCSDKTLSYLETARGLGLDAHLHLANIGGQPIHRLVRLEIEGRRYFADIGNGWPTIHLFPADEAIEYKCFGLSYHSEVKANSLEIYLTKNGKTSLQMILDTEIPDESMVRQSIASRFCSSINYPFSSKLRFSMIVGDQFRFIRDQHIEIYGEEAYYEEHEINTARLGLEILSYFNYDISPILNQKNE